MSDEDNEWKYIYPQSTDNDNESPRKRRRGLRNTSSLSPIGVQRLSDKEEFYIGDCVLLDSSSAVPYVGIIESFFFSEKGFMETKTIWFRRITEITRQAARKNAPYTLENELFITPDFGRDSIDILLQHVKVLTHKEYEATENKENVFFCRKAFNSYLGLFSSEDIDWPSIYKGRASDMGELMDKLLEITPTVKKRGVTVTPKVSPVKKPRPQRKVVIDLSTSEEEDDDDAEDASDVSSGEDEFFDAKSEIEESPVKRKRSPNKRTGQGRKPNQPQQPQPIPKTPTKRRIRSLNSSVKRITSEGSPFLRALPTRSPTKTTVPVSPHKSARDQLHVATVPDSLPCRESEFSQIFLSLESAIISESSTCVYVSGTPGTGKTATVREVIAQLQLRVDDGELPKFTFLEINGMKLTNPHSAYDILWEAISGKRYAAATAMVSLGNYFNSRQAADDTTTTGPIVVLMDELDQLVTKNQGVMYNFFHWPTLPDSKLIVIAVANTMDLPERMLSNKISSRLGLARIQFPGYNHEQLREIITTRLNTLPESEVIVEKDAIEFAARKIAGVSGDARRALDICRRAVELAQPEQVDSDDDPTQHKVTIDHIKRAISDSTSSPIHTFLRGLSMSAKIFVCAVLSRVRRSGVIDNPLGDVLQETERIVKLSKDAPKLTKILFGGKRVRMAGFQHALTELVEGGVLVQQMLRGERSANIRLSIGEEYIKSAFKNDPQVAGML